MRWIQRRTVRGETLRSVGDLVDRVEFLVIGSVFTLALHFIFKALARALFSRLTSGAVTAKPFATKVFIPSRTMAPRRLNYCSIKRRLENCRSKLEWSCDLGLAAIARAPRLQYGEIFLG